MYLMSYTYLVNFVPLNSAVSLIVVDLTSWDPFSAGISDNAGWFQFHQVLTDLLWDTLH